MLGWLTLWASAQSARARLAHPCGPLLSLPVRGQLALWASPLVLAARNQAVTTVCSVLNGGGVVEGGSEAALTSPAKRTRKASGKDV